MGINLKNKRVLFIDLDSTLIETASGKKFPEDISDFKIQLPVLDKIAEHLPNLKFLFIVTNQGGIGKYFTECDIKTKLVTITQFINLYLANHIGNESLIADYEYCPSMNKGDIRRKPNVGMLEVLCCKYSLMEGKDDKLMIGDASGKPGDWSDSDKKTAENFGIDYIDVRDFLDL